MNEPIWLRAEDLLARAHATSAKTLGTPLRTDTIALEHRQLTSALEEMLEFSKGQDEEHHRLVKLVWRVRAALIQGSNGTRFWHRMLPSPARTALTLLNNYLRLSSAR